LLFIVKKLLSAHLCSKEVPRGRGWGGGGGGGCSNKGKPPEGGRICHRVAAANPPPSPGLRSGATDDEQGRSTTRVESAFFFLPKFFPLSSIAGGLSLDDFLFLILLIQSSWACLFFFLQK
jgi:hypothetical protein